MPQFFLVARITLAAALYAVQVSLEFVNGFREVGQRFRTVYKSASGRVIVVKRIIPGIRVQLRAVAAKLQRILADEALKGRAVVSISIVVQPRAVVFSTRELIRISISR